MTDYNHSLIGSIGVDDNSENNEGRRGDSKLGITVGVDTLGTCTISFGSEYAIRIPEEDVDALRDLLFRASNQLMIQRSEVVREE